MYRILDCEAKTADFFTMTPSDLVIKEIAMTARCALAGVEFIEEMR